MAPISPRPAPESDNPLLRMFEEETSEPHDQRLHTRLAGLSPNDQSVEWIEQLLADPRLDLIEGGRARTVQTLLGFGHPFALRIAPHELERFRAIPQPPTRARIGGSHALMWVAAPLGALGGVWALMYSRSALPAGIFFLGTLAWGLTIFGRAAGLWESLPRKLLRREVPAAVFLSGVIAVAGHVDDAYPVVGTLVPVALCAALARWLDPRR